MNITGQSKENTIINGTGTGSIFDISGGANVNFQNLTLNGGGRSIGAAIDLFGMASSSTVTNCIITKNNATQGAIYVSYGWTLNVIDSTFTNNNAAVHGGAIANYGTLNVINSTFTNNTATINGGGIYNAQGVISVDNCEFTTNNAQSGGAIYSDQGTMTILNSVINGNTAQYAAAIDCRGDETSKITIKNTRIENNIGTNDGAIQNYCDMTIENCVISGNRANSRNGGAIVNYNNGILTVNNTVFQNNFAGRNGGVIYNENYRNVLFSDCQFLGNSSTIWRGNLL